MRLDDLVCLIKKYPAKSNNKFDTKTQRHKNDLNFVPSCLRGKKNIP